MLRELNAQFAAVKHGSIESVDGVVRISLIKVADKREAAAVLRVWVARDINVTYITVLLKHLDNTRCD